MKLQLILLGALTILNTFSTMAQAKQRPSKVVCINQVAQKLNLTSASNKYDEKLGISSTGNSCKLFSRYFYYEAKDISDLRFIMNSFEKNGSVDKIVSSYLATENDKLVDFDLQKCSITDSEIKLKIYSKQNFGWKHSSESEVTIRLDNNTIKQVIINEEDMGELSCSF